MKAPVKRAHFWMISVVLVGKNWSPPWPRNIFRIVVQSSQVTPIPVFPARRCGGCLSWPLCHPLHWKTHPIKNACLYESDTPHTSTVRGQDLTRAIWLNGRKMHGAQIISVMTVFFLLKIELWKWRRKKKQEKRLWCGLLALGVSGESSSTGEGGLLPLSWSPNNQYPLLQSLRKARPVSEVPEATVEILAGLEGG